MNHTVSFHGTGKEYFGIWIVNTLLKIVTLSVYTAWAKVRKRRYLAEKVFIDDEPFAYLATPMALFRGWLIAAVAVVLYVIMSYISPSLGSALAFMIAVIFPWVVVKSRIFNARNHSYRNIRFGFAPKYGGAYHVMFWLPMLIPLTLGIMAPYVLYRQKQFLVENSSYGTASFRFYARPGEFYKMFMFAFLWMLCPFLFIAITSIIFTKFTLLPKETIVFLYALVFLLLFAYYKAAVTNLVWNRTELGELQFYSSMKPLPLFWLYLSGGAAVIFSLGLLFPWASVRLMRYRCEQLIVRSHGGIADFIADTSLAPSGASGEEIGDMLGMDVDFGY